MPVQIERVGGVVKTGRRKGVRGERERWSRDERAKGGAREGGGESA